jgi:hypothetical protein
MILKMSVIGIVGQSFGWHVLIFLEAGNISRSSTYFSAHDSLSSLQCPNNIINLFISCGTDTHTCSGSKEHFTSPRVSLAFFFIDSIRLYQITVRTEIISVSKNITCYLRRIFVFHYRCRIFSFRRFRKIMKNGY